MLKQIIGVIAVVLTIVGYLPYIRDTLKGKTRPHIYTWFLWSFVSFIAFGLQQSDHAGPGSFVTLTAAVACLFICAAGLRQGEKDITLFDTLFLVLALISLVLWLFAKQPIASTVLVSLTDILAFVPTLRKSWKRPEQETLSSYVTNTIRFGLALIALNSYTVVASLYPWTWLFTNGFFSAFLFIRRKQLNGARQQ